MLEYKTYTKDNLIRILEQRNLSVYGTKAELVIRLTEYESRHPFPFLKLPGEIRDEIYKHVAASDNISSEEDIVLEETRRNGSGPSEIHVSDTMNRTSIAQPGLFRTCSKIYWESRLIFYHDHTFRLNIRLGRQDAGNKWDHRSWEWMKEWLDAIGVDARKQIQTLIIVFPCDIFLPARLSEELITTYATSVRDLYASLSGQATVIYRTSSPAATDLGCCCCNRIHQWKTRRSAQRLLCELGIKVNCSNGKRMRFVECPIHFYDSGLPRWVPQTFGRNFGPLCASTNALDRYHLPTPYVMFGPGNRLRDGKTEGVAA